MDNVDPVIIPIKVKENLQKDFKEFEIPSYSTI
jgi:hypothetical protein